MIAFPNEIIEKYSKTKPAYMRIYCIIRDSLLLGNISPYEKYTEESIAAQMNVSRTPVRTALAKLIAEGILPDPRKERQNFSKRDKSDIFFVLQFLESYACTLLVKRKLSREQLCEIYSTFHEIDRLLSLYEKESTNVSECDLRNSSDNFHLAIAKWCGNDLLNRTIAGLRMNVSTLGIQSIFPASQYAQMLQETTPFRKRLLDAFDTKDASKASSYLEAIILAEQELFCTP